jgi:ion channel
MLARPGRPFTTLFVCLLAAILVRPLLAYNRVGHVIFATSMIVFFVAAIGVLCRSRQERWMAVVLGLIWLGARVPELFLVNASARVEVIGRVAEIAFLSVIVTLLVAAILRKHTVTLDNILGAFAGYLLIALIFGIGFSLIELSEPGSFRVHDALQSEFASAAERDWVLNYFSCCTLMTVGYGDVTPVHAAARTLAVLEAMTGQLYLAVLVAVLVGMRVAQTFLRAPEAK